MIQAKIHTGQIVSHTAEFRDGHCPRCQGLLDEVVEHLMPYRWCSNCQEWRMGQLIVREVTVDPPKPPTCNKVSCLWKYLKAVLTYSMISAYEARRSAYAVHNRHKRIPERYRTGEPLPRTFFQALIANMKLTCPVCKRFNWTPFWGKE